MMFIRRSFLEKDNGLYTVEGSITIVIFTALIMMLLSIITIMETEASIQNAINQTAMQLSEYSYAVGGEIDITTSEETTLKEIIQSATREALGFTAGKTLCETLTKNRINENSISQIEGGFSGIDFSKSNILGDGKTITVVAIYEIKVNTFGLVDKRLNICQEAQTAAWLPYYADLLASSELTQGGSGSIWNETNFTRGQYFVREEKGVSPSNAVKSGQGIDLYYEDSGKVMEVYSLNIFSGSYSENNGDNKNASDYLPNSESIKKQIEKYTKEYQKDILGCGKTIIMEDGREEQFFPAEKDLILILPNEAKGQKSFVELFDEIKRETKSESGINLKIIYSEDAL